MISALIALTLFQPATQTSPTLVGTWQLQSTRAMNAAGEVVYEPEVQTGILILTESHYSLMWTRKPRPDAATHWAATDAEKLVSFNTMIAHSGKWSLENGHLRLDALTAKSPEFVGGHELFRFDAQANHLVLTAVMAVSRTGNAVPFYTEKGTQTYHFQRLAP